MSTLASELSGLGHPCAGEENAESASGAGVEQQDRGDDKDGHEERQGAETLQEEEDEDEEKQDAENENVEREERAREEQREGDREEEEEEEENDREEKEENAQSEEGLEDAVAKAHQHDEGAQQPVAKRERASEKHTTDELETPAMDSKSSGVSPETETGLSLVDCAAATASGLGVPPAGFMLLAPPMAAVEHAQAKVRVPMGGAPAGGAREMAKRCRPLSNHPSSEDAPLKKVNRPQVRPCAETAMDAEVASPGRLEVQLQELQSATGRGKDIHALAPPAMSEEGTTPRACLEGLQAQLQELLANEDYAGAAAIKEEMRVAELNEQEKARARYGELETKLAELLAQEDYAGAALVKEEMSVVAVTPQGTTKAAPLPELLVEQDCAGTAEVEESENTSTRQKAAVAKTLAEDDYIGAASVGERAKVYQEELSWQLRECVRRRDFVGAEACKQKLMTLPLQLDAETPQSQGAAATGGGQEQVADELVAKRGRTLLNHPSSEDAPPKKVNKPDVRPCAATAMVAEVATPEGLEMQLRELLAKQDYLGAAAVKEQMRTLALSDGSRVTKETAQQPCRPPIDHGSPSVTGQAKESTMVQAHGMSRRGELGSQLPQMRAEAKCPGAAAVKIEVRTMRAPEANASGAKATGPGSLSATGLDRCRPQVLDRCPPLQNGPGYSKANASAAKATGPGSLSATGLSKDRHVLAPPAMSDEGATSQACLEGLQARLKELLAAQRVMRIHKHIRIRIGLLHYA